jgi:nucleoside 2-deoxyribosyltransferase
MINNKSKFYIASPFFNDEQISKVNYIRDKLLEFYDVKNIYSPMHDSKYKLPDNPSYDDAMKVFRDNIDNIDDSDIVIVIIDDMDTGTFFELGYANQLSKQVIPVTFITGKYNYEKRVPHVGRIYLDSITYDQFPSVLRDLTSSIEVLLHVSDDNERNELREEIDIIKKSSNAYDNINVQISITNNKYRFFVKNSYLDSAQKISRNPDIVVMSRLVKNMNIASLWGGYYRSGIPIIALGKEARSNLMLQPSTIARLDTIKEVLDYILNSKDISYNDLKKNNILTEEEVI